MKLFIESKDADNASLAINYIIARNGGNSKKAKEIMSKLKNNLKNKAYNYLNKFGDPDESGNYNEVIRKWNEYLKSLTKKEESIHAQPLYERFFKEDSIPKYYKRKPISLLGKIRGKSYRIDIAPAGKGLILDSIMITENHNLVYAKNNREGGTVDQLLSKAFIEVFHLPVPINHDDIFGSGIDLNYMIYMLIENLDFKIK